MDVYFIAGRSAGRLVWLLSGFAQNALRVIGAYSSVTAM